MTMNHNGRSVNGIDWATIIVVISSILSAMASIIQLFD